MSIRTYAKEHNIVVVGKLTRIYDKKIKWISIYVDESGNQFWINRRINKIQAFVGGYLVN